MKKSILLIAAVVSFSAASFAATSEVDPSPYYIKELRSLVRNAPTAYSENIANHYLQLALKSKKMKDTAFRLSPQDITTISAAFQSDPGMAKLIATLELDQNESLAKD